MFISRVNRNFILAAARRTPPQMGRKRNISPPIPDKRSRLSPQSRRKRVILNCKIDKFFANFKNTNSFRHHRIHYVNQLPMTNEREDQAPQIQVSSENLKKKVRCAPYFVYGEWK